MIFFIFYFFGEAVVLVFLPLTENALINNSKHEDLRETKKNGETELNKKLSGMGNNVTN